MGFGGGGTSSLGFRVWMRLSWGLRGIGNGGFQGVFDGLEEDGLRPMYAAKEEDYDVN